MSATKFVIGGVFVVAALVSIVPLFKRDFSNFAHENDPTSAPVMMVNNVSGVASNDIIGTYNGISLKKSELNNQDKQSIFDAEMQLYRAQESLLAKRYFQKIIEKYAEENKIQDKSLAQRKYIESKVKIADSEVKSFIQENADNPQLKGKSQEEQMALVKPYLVQQAAGGYFRELVEKATTDGSIKVTGVKMPEALRVDVDTANSPSKGPSNAPVTIVEFADFQCPYCYSAQSTIKSVLEKYKNKVRFVFKSYPLSQIHPQAVNASVAAECAQNQGKFWEMHDVLFENHKKLTDSAYEGFAKQVGLDLPKFQSCFKDQVVRQKVKNDEAYGQSLGINATPAFYINGTLLMGAVPQAEFERLINKELDRKS